jgi:hypothetical protein
MVCSLAMRDSQGPGTERGKSERESEMKSELAGRLTRKTGNQLASAGMVTASE